MKRIFVIFALAATLVGCAKEDIVREAPRQAIGFGNPFIENATRVDYSSTFINAFKVYGTVTGNSNTVTIYNGADVTRGTAAYGEAWTCGQTEYWIPSASYNFQAVVDGEIADGKIAYTVGQDKGGDGISDLLYATASASTDANAAPTGDLQNGNVAFNFQHLLSKVGFTFTNGVTESTKYTFEVTAVSFTGHDLNGTYTIEGSAWDSAYNASTTALSFDVPANNVVTTTAPVAATTTHQIIPGNQALAIAVTYDIIYDGKKVYVGETAEKTLEYDFAKNNVYNIVVKLPAPGQPITFTVESTGVTGWENNGTATELK